MNGEPPNEEVSLWRFLATFVSVFIVVLTVLGAYLAADAVKQVWTFWVALPVTAVLVPLVLYGRRFPVWFKRVRDFQRVLDSAAGYQKQVEQLELDVASAESRAERFYAEGVHAGRAEVLGSYRAAQSNAVLAVEGTSIADGDLRLFAKLTGGAPPLIGARFVWFSPVTQATKGVVEVLHVDSSTHLVQLSCVQRTTEAFWEHLEKTAETSTALPKDLVLRPATSDDWMKVDLKGESDE